MSSSIFSSTIEIGSRFSIFFHLSSFKGPEKSRYFKNVQNGSLYSTNMTKFRGCIDIHSGQVKQIVGGTLTQDDITQTNSTKTNFISNFPSSHYANLYREHNITGCHVIKLGSNPTNDEAAELALKIWPGGLQIGGGINYDNAISWLEKGASHVILTSYLFSKVDENMVFDWEKLKKVSEKVGKERLIVDLSCRTVVKQSKVQWVVAMNKWQTLTSSELSGEFLKQISEYCDEFLIHAADVEGLCQGIDEKLVEKLGEWCPIGFEGKVVYAGGAKSVQDLDVVNQLSKGKVDLTYGSALDIFGGNLVKFDEVVAWNKSN